MDTMREHHEEQKAAMQAHITTMQEQIAAMKAQITTMEAQVALLEEHRQQQ